jgi:hypothetical protein
MIVRFYQGLYLFPALQTHWLRLLEEDIDYLHYLREIWYPTEGQNLPDDAVDTKNDSDNTPAALNIQALEQLAADNLVENFYKNPDILWDVLGWGQYACVFSDHWYMPDFNSSDDQFCILVCNTFHNHSRRSEVAKY